MLNVSPARERLDQRKALWLSRLAAALLLSFVLLIGDRVAAYAEPSGSSLTIDYDKLPTIAIEARDVPSTQVLNQLAEGLHFQVDSPSSIGKSPRISGSFKGDISEILRRVVLRQMSYVVLYRGSAIERIIITTPGGNASVVDASSSLGAEDASSIPAAPTTQIAAASPLSRRGGGALQTQGPVVQLLQAQASMAQLAVTDIGAAGGSNGTAAANSASRSIPQPRPASIGTAPMSLAAMTRAAQTNVRTLVKALDSACIGASCAQ
jgi:hypothetical protein